MCSTPRSSGSARKVHRLPTSKAHFKSQAQLMRRASEMYDIKQQQRSKQLKEKNIKISNKVEKQILDSEEMKSKENSIMDRFNQFIDFMRAKIPPIVTS